VAQARALEQALAAETAGADGVEVLALLEDFVREPDGSPTEEEYAFLVRGADLAFTSVRYALAEALYDLLASHGRGGEGVLLRQVHVRILRDDPEAALTLLAELAPDVAWSVNGDRLRAIALMDLDRPREAVPVLRTVIARAPEDTGFARLLVQALKASGEAAARLEELDELVARLPEEERFELLFRVRLAAGDHAGLERLWRESPPEVPSPAADRLGPLIQELTAAHEHDVSERLLGAIGARGALSPKLAAAALGHFLVQGDWDSAEHWLATARSSPAFDDEPHLRLKELQYFCFTLQLEEAEKLAAAWRSVAEMPPGAAPVVAALYGSLGRWEHVIELLRECLEHSVEVESEVFLEAVGLAARRTGRYADVTELLRRSAGDGDAPAAVQSLLDRLAVEVAFLVSLGRLEQAAAADHSLADPFYADRALAFSRLLASGRQEAPPTVQRPPASREPAEGTIVFCTDRRYLVGTCVAVSSLLRHNESARARFEVAVVSSADGLDLATEALGAIGAAWGTRIGVIPAAELVAAASGGGLRTGWGCFTPGHGLSEAAYYRLFAIKKLLDDGATGRVVYLDSDICFGGGVDEFFRLDLGDAPLAARFELDLPSIAQAARKLGLDRETYFNSGVLLFDLEHPELPEALARSIEIAIEQPELLTFLDQCALNVAFKGRVEPLPERLNYYVRPKDELNGAEPAVWHFLTHWKPWDPQYASENCRVWDAELTALAEVVSTDVLAALLSLQFETAYVPEP
jgi:lipopolysaccharide biosynthesis glycosyltransferase